MVISMCHAFGDEGAGRGPSVGCCVWILLTLRPFPAIGREGVLPLDDTTYGRACSRGYCCGVGLLLGLSLSRTEEHASGAFRRDKSRTRLLLLSSVPVFWLMYCTGRQFALVRRC